ncbi:hypothetical protein FRC02_003085 [Tulasnella sp. 418]|nr:hypothetical protein FRC02_003085 [Tulasnella sp. 418]
MLDNLKAIIYVYDIFGFYPQTQQGADIIAESLNATVLMPDFFRGKPFPADKYPPKTDEEKEELQKFFKGVADLKERLPELVAIGEQLKKDGVKKIGTLGVCWVREANTRSAS